MSQITMKEAINKVIKGNHLTTDEAMSAMDMMLGGDATNAQIAAFLTAMRMKGETIEEIVGCAKVMQAKAEHVKPNVSVPYLDLVGTGGDGTNTFNISTTSAFVAAGAGVPIAKHGNRAVSSKSGAADVLEALGVKIVLPTEVVEKSVEEVGIGFMFAQTFNKSMKNVSTVRKEMGARTIFNILGPISNPSNATAVIIGVFNRYLNEHLANVLKNMGVKSGMVVCGNDGMDEITLTGVTYVSEIKNNEVINYEIDPKDYGFDHVRAEELVGGVGEENAKITRDILSGELKGAKRNIVLLNAGAAIYCAGLAKDLNEGIEKANESIDSGKALSVLNKLVEFTNREW